MVWESLIFLTIVFPIALVIHLCIWSKSRDVPRWKLIAALPLTIFIPSVLTGIVFLAIVYVVDGSVAEPVRFIGIIMLMSLPVNALMALFVAIFPRQKHVPEGCCVKCGYDLRYLDGCPECGWRYKT